MKVASRLIAFSLVLAVAFGVAAAVGSAVGAKRGQQHDQLDPMSGASGEMAMSMAPGALPQGLAVEEDKLRLVPDRTTFDAGRRELLRFRIVDSGGTTVRDFELEHAKRLHLIVVRRDLTDYQHIHPTQAADGSWSIPLTLADPGVYRVFADFVANGYDNTVLGTDLFVAGDFAPQPLPSPTSSTTVDGYRVTLKGDPRAGYEGPLTFWVSRGGTPVTVEPYLDADGHLVALRQGDLAYLHVHPLEAPGHGGPIVFMTDSPSVGTYRLFLQFKAAGSVHTAEFTQVVR